MALLHVEVPVSERSLAKMQKWQVCKEPDITYMEDKLFYPTVLFSFSFGLKKSICIFFSNCSVSREKQRITQWTYSSADSLLPYCYVCKILVTFGF